ncbi:hypothetical protein OG946_14690 [Streptomyces sp. NBC_01808]|uniref:hypothetical protein n=1 Tax=Streptomyces sp. NBC_01808 TaxID=2975947 RepID=UPI002DDC42B0|nr:hypothetical protein [Streptomyces sp. NBC_01808]WSA38513.1 hypothetical protein OG946_14690 [Streptomyces sp. NBC_01808]
MGIESDQLVYDYLSRVGDIAQQRALPSGQRMRLVNELRASIDKVRAAEGAHSVSAVKQVLARFGSPGDIVEAAKRDPASAVPEVAVQPGEPPGGGGGLTSRLPRPRVGGSERWLGRLPRPRTGGGETGGRPGGREPKRPAPEVPRTAPENFTPPAEPPPTAAAPPHLAGEDELDPTHADPDWWRVEPAPFAGPMPGAGSGADNVPGFTGGIELPELFQPPDQQDGDEEEKGAQKGGGTGAMGRAARAAKAAKEANAARAARAAKAKQARREAAEAEEEEAYEDEEPSPPSRRGTATRELLRSAGLMEVLAMGALLGGAALDQWMASVVGWALVYTSRRLSMTEKKWAALGVPGTVGAAGLVWLWGRSQERWGEPLKEGTLGQEFSDLLPTLVRFAAVASTLFLLWRARRRLRK